MFRSGQHSEEQKWGIAFGQNTIKKSLQHPRATYFKEITYQNPLDIFSKLYSNHKHMYLLESIEGPKRLANFSFIGFNPRKVVTAKNGKAVISEDENISTVKTDDPLKLMEKELGATTPDHTFRLIGGAVGYISYDAVRYWENLPNTAIDDLNLPDVEMGVYDEGIAFDHRERKAYYYYTDKNRLSEIREQLKEASSGENKLEFSKLKPNMSKEEFEESIRKAKQYISSGDIFQTVFSKRYDFNITGNLLGFYEALRIINPSPYMYFLKHGETQIVGSSPEMLTRVDKQQIETYPIAGTCPTTEDPEKNRALAEALLADPKERAEHIMLVDLARNDIGRVSQSGSVHVPQLMTVNQYSHVQHIVSRVVGQLQPDKNCFDALRAMLPAGTVSGAPKVRAMEIIDELEPTRRGPYAGAVGYFSRNGNADFAITIRTLVARGCKASIQVGAGIVADSDPEREWFETESKAAALMKALSQAGEAM